MDYQILIGYFNEFKRFKRFSGYKTKNQYYNGP
jgi:hypothetical protein